MDIPTLLIQQATDVFRLGLLAGLIYTTERTRANTGVAMPLAAGIVFVAFIIPTTMPQPGVPLWLAITSGIVVNAAIAAAFWLAYAALTKPRSS